MLVYANIAQAQTQAGLRSQSILKVDGVLVWSGGIGKKVWLFFYLFVLMSWEHLDGSH